MKKPPTVSRRARCAGALLLKASARRVALLPWMLLVALLLVRLLQACLLL